MARETKTYKIEMMTNGGLWRRVAGPFRSTDEYGALRYFARRDYPGSAVKLTEDTMILFATGTHFRAVEVS